MPKKLKVRELLLYNEKVSSEEVTNLFNQVLKAKIPFLGFLDFSDFFSINILEFIITRKINTIQFFVKDKSVLSSLSMLVFPYKISEVSEIEKRKSTIFPFPKLFFLFGDKEFINFMLKEHVEEIHLRIIKIFGKFLGIGSAIDEKGRKSFIFSFTPTKFLVVDLEKNPSVYIEVLDPIPKRVSMTSQYPVFEETGITVGVDNFDVFQHTLLVGASGTGKSRALYAIIKAIEAKYGDSVRMVIIDPHGEFIRSLYKNKIVDYVNNYIEPLSIGNIKTPLMTQLIAQLLSSAIGQENKYSERVLFYVVHILTAIDKMDLNNISLILTDPAKRAEFLSQVENEEVKRFFDEEFNDIYIHHFNDAILPILNFVGEYNLYLGSTKKIEDLLDLINNNRIVVISFNPNFFGKRMINFLAGAVINQMYILAITEKLKKPTILIVDEFQRVETKIVKDILAETRKFNLYIYMSMQYLGQMSKEVADSVVSNIRNIVSFKANRQDATMLSSIMEIKIEESFKKSRTQTELEESKKEMFIRLHQRECIVRLFDGKRYILPMKLRVVDVNSIWGYHELPLEQVLPIPPNAFEIKKAVASNFQNEKVNENRMMQNEMEKNQSENSQQGTAQEEISQINESNENKEEVTKSQEENLQNDERKSFKEIFQESFYDSNIESENMKEKDQEEKSEKSSSEKSSLVSQIEQIKSKLKSQKEKKKSKKSKKKEEE